jgi:hypothetical protein
MNGLRLIGFRLAVLLSVLPAWAAEAAELVPLPEALLPGVEVVAWVDLQALEADRQRPLFEAMGAGGDVPMFATPLAELRDMARRIAPSGGERVIALIRPQRGLTETDIVFSSMPDTDLDQMEAAVEAWANDRGPGVNASRVDDWIVLRGPQAGPQVGQVIAELPAVWREAADAPMGIIWSASPDTRAQFARIGLGPNEPIQTAFRRLVNARYGRLTATYDEPALRVQVRMNDADEAAALIESARDMREAVRQQMEGRGQADSASTAWAAIVFSEAFVSRLEQVDDTVVVLLNDEGLTDFRRERETLLAAAHQDARKAQLASNMRQVLIGVQAYAADHRGKLPAILDDLGEYLPHVEQPWVHPETNERPAFEYVRPADTLDAIREPSRTPLLYELRGGQRVEGGWIGYADGHVARAPAPDAVAPAAPDAADAPAQ